ncbi:MAG: hypothetical protein V4530_06110 [Pseudomonadota bacterium]
MTTAILMAAASTLLTCPSDDARRPDPAQLRMSEVGVEVKPPRHVLPTVHGGKDGWFQLRKAKATPDAITGKIPANLMANANLLFDRRSNRLTITGAHGDFTGICASQ